MGAIAEGVVGPRARIGLAVGLVCVLVTGACGEQSRVDPNARVTVSGTVRAPGGAVLADRPVRLGGGVGIGEGLFATLTLGLACTTGVCSGKVLDATTAADGTYRFELRGRETWSTFGEALSQLVSASAAPTGGQVSGAAASARFRIQVPDVRLPPLDLVDPGLSVEGRGAVVARWSTPHPGPYELTVEKAETLPVWRVTTAEGTASIDPRVLEDTSGRVVVAGGSTDRIEGSALAVHWGPRPIRAALRSVQEESGRLRDVFGGGGRGAGEGGVPVALSLIRRSAACCPRWSRFRRRSAPTLKAGLGYRARCYYVTHGDGRGARAPA